MTGRNEGANDAQVFVKVTAGLLFVIGVLLFVFASMYQMAGVEPEQAGLFEMESFNNWTLVDEEGNREAVTLPYSNSDLEGTTVELMSTLDEVSDGMTLTLHSIRAQVSVYIGEELRSQYIADDYAFVYRYMPSAYIAVPLYGRDSGQDVRIVYMMSNSGVIEDMDIGYGNNAFVRVIRHALPIIIGAFFLIFMGCGSFVIYFILPERKKIGKPMLRLGGCVLLVAFWVLSESEIRQFMFKTPSLVVIFTTAMLGGMVLFYNLYIDATQEFTYHHLYVCLEKGIILQLVFNTILHFVFQVEFYQTKCMLHGWIGISCLLSIVTVLKDACSRDLKKYHGTCYAVGILAVMVTMELYYFYNDKPYIAGCFICMGMVAVWLASIVQMERRLVTYQYSKSDHMRRMTIKTIETVASAIDAKDEYTGGHSERVAEYAGIIGRAVANHYQLDEEDLINLQYVARMHDIGKLAVPDAILNKTGTLSDDEYTLMKRHVIIGDELLSSIDDIDGLHDGVRYHHERYDGKGYPDGLKGAEIPLIARILCMADCYDAMTSNRVYRRRLSDKEVIREIQNSSGSQFDPYIASVCCQLIEQGKLKPSTDDGLATNAAGEALISSKLEYMLQTNIDHGLKIVNPSNIRMAANIIKVSESKKQRTNVYIVGTNATSKYASYRAQKEHYQKICECISKYSTGSDFSIIYSADSKLVVFYDHTMEDCSDFVKEMISTTEDSVFPLIESV